MTDPYPTDRGKPGTKYHLLTDAAELSLHVPVSVTNTHESRLFEPLLETITRQCAVAAVVRANPSQA